MSSNEIELSENNNDVVEHKREEMNNPDKWISWETLRYYWCCFITCATIIVVFSIIFFPIYFNSNSSSDIYLNEYSTGMYLTSSVYNNSMNFTIS